MLSKSKIWENIKQSKSTWNSEASIHALYCYDQYAFKYFKDGMGIKFQVVFGNEITEDWIDQKLRTMDLFGGSDNYLIHFAEDISSNVIDHFLQPEGLLLDNCHILLNFTKDNASFKKLVKADHIDGIQIMAPAFWEEQELLKFIGQQKAVYLGFEETRHFCENVPFEFGKYSDVLDQLRLKSSEENQITIMDIDEVLTFSKFDQFKLAELFGAKKMVPFYRQFLALAEESQDFYGFLYFMNTHMQKVFNPNYGEDKKKLSKYDKQILHQQKLWNSEQAARAANYFNDLLSLYKADKTGFLDKLRSDYLKVLVQA